MIYDANTIFAILTLRQTACKKVLIMFRMVRTNQKGGDGNRKEIDKRRSTLKDFPNGMFLGVSRWGNIRDSKPFFPEFSRRYEFVTPVASLQRVEVSETPEAYLSHWPTYVSYVLAKRAICTPSSTILEP